jgi:hypothetical protein
MSAYCIVPWIGQDSSTSKGEGKLVPVNDIKAHGERTSRYIHIWPWLQMKVRVKAVGGPVSVAGIATSYGLVDRIQVGVRLSAPVQTGIKDNPASCTMGTGNFLW